MYSDRLGSVMRLAAFDAPVQRIEHDIWYEAVVGTHCIVVLCKAAAD
jgi:hypothetical protein